MSLLATFRSKGMHDALETQLHAVEIRQMKLRACLDFETDHIVKTTDGDVININIGGKKIIIMASALFPEQSEHSLLGLKCLLWNDSIPRDQHGVVFLDLNPDWVEPTLNLLRTRSYLELQPTPYVSPTQKNGYDAICSYYNLADYFVSSNISLSEKSTIECMNGAVYQEKLHQYICPDNAEVELNFELIHRGSRDGFAMITAHEKNKTITVIQDTNNNVFGGFENNSPGNKLEFGIKEGFLFSLISSAGFDSVKFPFVNANHHNQQQQYYQQTQHLKYFRNGEIILSHNCNVVSNSVRIGESYSSPHRKDNYCTGYQTNFTVKELEVYNLQLKIHKNQQKSISTPIELISKHLNAWIQEALVKGGNSSNSFKLKLLYRGTRDGFCPVAFHQRCDRKSSTLCLIEDDQGNLVGGFADKPWTSPANKQEVIEKSANSFAFDLGKLGLNPIKRASNLQQSSTHFCRFPGSVLLSADGKVTNHLRTPSGTVTNAVDITVHEIIYPSADYATDIIAQIEDAADEAIADHIIAMATAAQQAEEKLLLRLLYLDHLSTPITDRQVTSGLLADWHATRTCHGSFLPLHNGLKVTSSTETMRKIEEVIERLKIKKNASTKVGNKSGKDGSHGVK